MKRQQPKMRRGVISVLAAVLSIVLIALVAFSVDVGYVLTAKEELQRTADAAALATCWEYAKQRVEGQNAANATLVARTTAAQYAASNAVTNSPMYINPNTSNNADGDVVFGYISDLGAGADNFQTGDDNLYNAVRVRVRKEAAINGKVPYFFARIFGMQGQVLRAEATAAIVRDVNGFRVPADGSNLQILPFALDLDTWTSWAAGQGADDWTWDPDTKAVSPGSDGKPEVNLYPEGTDAASNRGTVDIGGPENSATDLSRQIRDGVSPQDMQALSDLGKSLEFDANGNLNLSGETGISAGAAGDLAAIVGESRVIPVYSTVVNPGGNASYTVVKWFGVRVMDVQLDGPTSNKHVMIQAAPIVMKGVVPASETGTSSYVFSSVVLVK